jgi:hypothetical protein
MSMGGVIQVNITVADTHLDQFDHVVQRCQEVGLRVEQQFWNIGVISGRIEAAKLPDLKRIEGVAAVETSRTIQIAPPESNVQ